MDKQIMVSVVCNVYNHEKYLPQALDGFVAQKTNFPFEVLVHDDASTDSSAEIIREYEKQYPHIIKPIYQSENQYSKGIRITPIYQFPRIQGKYVAICEGDDCWTDPLKLQKQFDFMEANPDYSLCACSTKWQNLKTGVVENRGRTNNDIDLTLEDLIMNRRDRFFQTASVFIKADVFMQMPAWRSKFPVGDLPLAILAGLNGKVHMLADQMCIYHYYAENSWTICKDNDDARSRIAARMIEGYNALNEATDYQYNDIITKRIKVSKYTHALMTHDLKTLLSDELRDIYQSRSLVFRLSDVVRCKFPKIYNSLLKPLARKVKSQHVD